LAWELDQEQTVPLTDVRYLETPLVKIVPTNDDLFSLTARRGNGYHGFKGDVALSPALEFDPHRVPPELFWQDAGVSERRDRLLAASVSGHDHPDRDHPSGDWLKC